MISLRLSRPERPHGIGVARGFSPRPTHTGESERGLKPRATLRAIAREISDFATGEPRRVGLRVNHRLSLGATLNPLAVAAIVALAVLGLGPRSVVAAAAPAATTAAAKTLLLDVAVIGHAVVAVGEHGTILRSVDNGRTWEKIPTPTHATLTCVAFADGRFGWAAGHDGVVLVSADAGESWRPQYQTEKNDTIFLDLAALDSRRVFAVGAFGVFFSSGDGGRTWTQRRVLEEELHLNRLSLGENNRLHLAGERGTLLRLTDLGKTAAPLASPGEGSLYGVLPLGDGALLAYGLLGRVFRSTDDGASWTPVPTSAPPALLAAGVKLKSGAIVLAGQARAFLVSHDGGATFSPWPAPLTAAVAELVELPDGALLAVGEAGPTRLDPPTTPARTRAPGSPAAADDAPRAPAAAR